MSVTSVPVPVQQWGGVPVCRESVQSVKASDSEGWVCRRYISDPWILFQITPYLLESPSQNSPRGQDRRQGNFKQEDKGKSQPPPITIILTTTTICHYKKHDFLDVFP